MRDADPALPCAAAGPEREVRTAKYAARSVPRRPTEMVGRRALKGIHGGVCRTSDPQLTGHVAVALSNADVLVATVS